MTTNLSKRSPIISILSVCAFGMILATVAGCASTTGLSATFCETAEPIRWHESDSANTVRAAKRHNAKGIELKCQNVNRAWKR